MTIPSWLLNAIRGPQGLRDYSYSWKVTALQCNNVGRARELCESRGGCPRLPVGNRPYGPGRGGCPFLIVCTVSVDVKQHWTRTLTVLTSELRSCVKVGMDAPGSPFLIVCTVFVDVKQHWTRTHSSVLTAQGLCESRGGRPGLPVPIIVRNVSVDVKQHWTRTLTVLTRELRSSVKVKVAVLGSPFLIVRTVSVDVKQH